MSLVYDELRALAGGFLKRERDDHTLQPTALVHEVYLKLAGEPDETWNDALHFKAVAVRAMRRILVDHARQKGADKRGGDWQRITLRSVITPDPELERGIDLVDLDRALAKLERLHERQARVVELRFLGGLTVRETAQLLDINESTVKADWSVARLFLVQELGESD